MGWIRICMDPELLPRSGSGTRKIQSWIRIHNTDRYCTGITLVNKTFFL